MEPSTSLHNAARTPRLIKQTGDGGSTGGIPARLGLVGYRAYFCVFVQLSLNISLPVVLGEEGRSVSHEQYLGTSPCALSRLRGPRSFAWKK